MVLTAYDVDSDSIEEGTLGDLTGTFCAPVAPSYPSAGPTATAAPPAAFDPVLVGGPVSIFIGAAVVIIFVLLISRFRRG